MTARTAPDVSLAADKAALRGMLRRRLGSLEQIDREAVGLALALHLEVDRYWGAARAVALFVSLADEVDTGPLIAAAHRSGKEVLIPRCGPDASLEFARYAEGDELVPGRYGLKEPAARVPPSDLLEADLVLVPGLAFDARGGRLGRGAGYYDRTLQPVRHGGRAPTLVGLCHHAQVVEAVPMADHDVRVDRVLTEMGWLQSESNDAPSGRG